MKHTLRFRQVHLDFHTHGSIPGVGADFNPGAFAETLEAAHVDSITCFARCHHGWLYYDSKAFPQLVHPNLKNRNLLKEQIEACHARGIKVPVYTTVQWDEQIAHAHYDWLSVDENGAPFHQPPFKAGFYRNLCLNSPYVAYLKAHVKDIFDSLGTLDGLFFDILNIQPCCCNHCLDEMRSRGLDATDETVRYEFAQEVFDRFQLDLTRYIHSIQPDCPVFYNVGYIGTQHRKSLDSFTHLEIESLPGGSWGYDHFPVTARYARTLGFDTMGMTGKFHTDWGDFGSLRNQSALEYECFKALAYGAKCSIGDQLHPRGVLNEPAYALIGRVYKSVAEKEPWCVDAKPVCEAAVFASSEYQRAGTQLVTPELTGAVKMLVELGLQFDVIDSRSDLSRYKLLVLPDGIAPMEQPFAEKLAAYVQGGGGLITSFRSGLEKNSGLTADFLPAEIGGQTEFCPDYIPMEGPLAAGLPETEFVMYAQAAALTVRPGATQLLKTNAPYFNRTWEHYCSHQHAPSSGVYYNPAVVQKDRIYQFAHPIFTIYQQYCPAWIKQMVKNAVLELLKSQLVSHDGPSSLELSLMEQPANNRFVLHALHYIPVRKSEKMDIIEDTIALSNVQLTLSLPRRILAANIVPEGTPLPIRQLENGSVTLQIPTIQGHTMIELCYEA